MTLVTQIKNSLRRRDGPLTQDLVQVPADFGLGKIPAGIKPDDVTNVICGFCSVGCSLNIHLKNGQAINLTPDPEYPVNLGMACPKGWEALTPLAAPDRATTPLLKNKNGGFDAVDWDTAMQVFTLRFKAIQDKFGKESVAWLGTGQIATEELAFLGSLAKFGMGVIHGDGNTRQCMATSAVAYKQSFGFDAPPFTYKDLEESDVLVFIGSNLCIAHPILWQRVLRNRNNPDIIVIDPRKTEIAMAATQHYAIKPKSDLVLLYGLARILIEKNWIDREFIEKHTTGFVEFEKFLCRSRRKEAHSNLNPGMQNGELKSEPPHVGCYSLEEVSAATGISIDELHRFAEKIHRGKRVSFWWTMGVNQGHEATRTAQAIINLALMTGNIGRPGTGANSITGQCNAMGSRLFSNTTNLLAGHDFLNTKHREKVTDILGLNASMVPQQNSWAYDQIVEEIEQGKIKGLWIVGTNSSHSWIHNTKFNQILQKLDFLVVQDMYATTETAQRANLVLPAAGWGEKEGTFINSERRIGLIKKVSKAPGQALSDFNIFKLIAHYWGCGNLFKEWTSPEVVFQLLKKLSRGQPCDITGISDYRMIEESGGIQWPLAQSSKSEVPGSKFNFEKERRLFEDGVFCHADGKAKFIFDEPRAMPDATNGDFPFLLLTGRGTSAQWHTETRTGKSAVLHKLHAREIYAEINPADARRLGISDNEKIKIISRRGEIEVMAMITSTVQPAQIFIPMHYVEINSLITASFDPHSRQPAYKNSAVMIRRLR